MTKTVHIHVGPHKTGSTAIQHQLRATRHTLALHGVRVIYGPAVSALAQALAAEDQEAIAVHLAQLRSDVDAAAGDCVMSCEDFAGDLVGRNRKRRIYPRLWPNLDAIQQGFAGLTVKFYFFCRDPEPWLASAYAQHLRFRTRFSSLDGFVAFFETDALWDGVLARAREQLGPRLVELPYWDDPDFSSVDALVEAIFGLENAPNLPQLAMRSNASPPPHIIKVLEAINGSSASSDAKRNAKQVLLDPTSTRVPQTSDQAQVAWPPKAARPDWLSPGLDSLWARVERRVQPQDQPWVLPEVTADLAPFREDIVTAEETFPEGDRSNMMMQERKLAFRFRGMPRTCLLLGLTISYLRRATRHSADASALFQRLWAEEHAILLGLVQTRWLISTFQTFMDHGANDAQRTIGAAGYFMSNTLKLYEAERAIEGLAPDAVYPGTKAQTKTGFRGLDRFGVGGTDLMVNHTALFLELAAHDPIAGRVAQEFLLRLKTAHSAFSRMDRSRVHHDVNIPQFASSWSFSDPPK